MDFGSHPLAANVSQSDMAALKRILSSIDGALVPKQSPHVSVSIHNFHETITLARRMKAARDQRSRLFEQDLFGEPAWDMMLALYIAAGEGYRLKVTALSQDSGVASTTALRWIHQLIDLGLARKVPNPFDARSHFIEGTELLSTKMTEYLREVLEKQLTPKVPNR